MAAGDRAMPAVLGRSIKALWFFCLVPSLSQYFRLAEDIGGVWLVTFLCPDPMQLPHPHDARNALELIPSIVSNWRFKRAADPYKGQPL
jgi:hypothetical protein